MPESGASKLYYDLESRIHLDSHGSEGLTSYTVTTGPCYVEDQHSRPHPSLKLQHLYWVRQLERKCLLNLTNNSLWKCNHSKRRLRYVERTNDKWVHSTHLSYLIKPKGERENWNCNQDESCKASDDSKSNIKKLFNNIIVYKCTDYKIERYQILSS